MATDIISSKIYKLLDELNIPNEGIEMRPQVVEKIIDLIWNNTLITDRGSSRSGVAPTPKVRPTDCSTDTICSVCGQYHKFHCATPPRPLPKFLIDKRVHPLQEFLQVNTCNCVTEVDRVSRESIKGFITQLLGKILKHNLS